MKLKQIDKQWDYMPANAFDDLKPEEAYTKLYDYAVSLEQEVRIQRSKVRMFQREVRMLNLAMMRKNFAIDELSYFFKVLGRSVKKILRK